jgi:hypothetical protein
LPHARVVEGFAKQNASAAEISGMIDISEQAGLLRIPAE